MLLVVPQTSKLIPCPNIQVAYWLTNNVDFDQCILEYYKPEDDQAGWIHVSYDEKGSNRNKYLPLMVKNTPKVYQK